MTDVEPLFLLNANLEQDAAIRKFLEGKCPGRPDLVEHAAALVTGQSLAVYLQEGTDDRDFPPRATMSAVRLWRDELRRALELPDDELIVVFHLASGIVSRIV